MTVDKGNSVRDSVSAEVRNGRVASRVHRGGVATKRWPSAPRIGQREPGLSPASAWIWATLQRQRFNETFSTAAPPDDGAFRADESWASMFLRYVLLWSVIEGFQDRDIELRGPFADDIQSFADEMRRARNVVFHVGQKDQNDVRLFGLIQRPESAAAMHRIRTGFGPALLRGVTNADSRGSARPITAPPRERPALWRVVSAPGSLDARERARGGLGDGSAGASLNYPSRSLVTSSR